MYSYTVGRQTITDPVFTPQKEKKNWCESFHLQFCSCVINFTPKIAGKCKKCKNFH